MIKESEVSLALSQHLSSMPLVPFIAWPNKHVVASQPKPYLVTQVVRISRVDPTVAGGFAISEGQFVVTVIESLGEYATAAERLADCVADFFPMGLRIPFEGGEITITQPPLVNDGFPDEISWRVPVTIPYQVLPQGG